MRNSTALLLLAASLMASCGGHGDKFKLSGRLLNINQGQFYVYSAEGDVEGIDTIDVKAGRFEYATELPRATTLMIVFPNFTEQPVFAEPTASVKIDGDASHLKDMTVKGTPDNELMNAIRPRLADASQQERAKMTEQFIKEHPDSRVGIYLVRRCLLQAESPDFGKARSLVDQMLAHQPKNGALVRLKKDLQGRGFVAVGKSLPAFKATDTGGHEVTAQAIQKADVGVVLAWASWNYESLNTLKQLNRMKKKAGSRLQFIAISLDASAKECTKRVEADSIICPIVCDEQSSDGALCRLLGLNMPGNCLVFEKGKLVARGLRQAELKRKAASKLGFSPDDF